MMKLALSALVAGLMACGGDDAVPLIFLDAHDVNDDCEGVIFDFCNPPTQTGCNAGEKCTWFNGEANPPGGEVSCGPVDHPGCAPDGTVAIGDACTANPAGPMGYDNCARGGVCLTGICKSICDLQGGSPGCPTNYTCTRDAEIFIIEGGYPLAGVCEPSCDPNPLVRDVCVPAPGTREVAHHDRL